MDPAGNSTTKNNLEISFGQFILKTFPTNSNKNTVFNFFHAPNKGTRQTLDIQNHPVVPDAW